MAERLAKPEGARKDLAEVDNYLTEKLEVVVRANGMSA